MFYSKNKKKLEKVLNKSVFLFSDQPILDLSLRKTKGLSKKFESSKHLTEKKVRKFCTLDQVFSGKRKEVQSQNKYLLTIHGQKR